MSWQMARNGSAGMQTGQGDWPAGLLSHAAGEADDGTFIVAEVWSSHADQDAFMPPGVHGGEGFLHDVFRGSEVGYQQRHHFQHQFGSSKHRFYSPTAALSAF